MNFETLVAFCQYAFIAFFVLLGIAYSLPNRMRKTRVIAGVCICLGYIIGFTIFTEWLYNTAPTRAYENHVLQEQEKGTP